MADAETAVKEAAPAIGTKSRKGARWFVSCRYPHLNVTIRPALDKTSTTRAVKGVYAMFKVGAKPNVFAGDGRLGTENHSGTDKNDSPFWGIYKTYEPGPEPEDGYKDDGKDVPREERLTAAQKKLYRETCDVLRGTMYYAKTVQDNEVDRLAQLKELDWDPTPLSGSIKGYVARGRQTLGKDGVKEAPVPAPAETRAPAPAAKVPSLARPRP